MNAGAPVGEPPCRRDRNAATLAAAGAVGDGHDFVQHILGNVRAVTTMVTTGGGQPWLTNSVWRAAWVAAQAERRRVRLEEALRAARPHLDPRPHGPLALPHPHHSPPTPTSKPRFSGSVWCAPRRSNSPSTLPLPSSRYCSEPAQARRTVFHERAARAAAPPRPPPRRDPTRASRSAGRRGAGGVFCVRRAPSPPRPRSRPGRGGGAFGRPASALALAVGLWLTAREARAEPGKSRAQPGTLVFWVREALPAGGSILHVAHQGQAIRIHEFTNFSSLRFWR